MEVAAHDQTAGGVTAGLGEVRSVVGSEDKWVAIQHKTFSNWVNEQLQATGRSVENLATDLCDGVHLVALLEALQFKKIGRVYKKPTSRIQMLENVGLAFKAIADDNIRLVNIGNEDVVNGNLKLILGLLWHLILRYQISSSKTRAPPKKLMLSWFQSVIPDAHLTNFTTDWNDGIALHALIDYCKPGTCPNWRSLDARDKVDNCRRAMALAKQHLNIPKVVSAEDFASPALDELSAMTYLSYFIKRDSPGYYTTMNWVCRQLRTTTVSNLTTDWNDGYYLCAIVSSLGGEVEGWPNLHRQDQLGNLQKGMDAAKKLGVEPILTAAEMADSHVDHLALMAYVSKFQNVTPRKGKAEKLTIDIKQRSLVAGHPAQITLDVVDVSVDRKKVSVAVSGESGHVDHQLSWQDSGAVCVFRPPKPGSYSVRVHYDGQEIVGSPVLLSVGANLSKARFLTHSLDCRVGDATNIEVDVSSLGQVETRIEATSPSGETRPLSCVMERGVATSVFKATHTGAWTIRAYVEGQELPGSPIQVSAFDPIQAWLNGPTNSVVGETSRFSVNTSHAGSHDVTAVIKNQDGKQVHADITTSSEGKEISFTPNVAGRFSVQVKLKGSDVKGSPLYMEVSDPGQVVVSGDGLERGMRGMDAIFTVNTAGVKGEVIVEVQQANGRRIESRQRLLKENIYEFRYLPPEAGIYTLHVRVNGRDVRGSPFKPGIIDRSCVTLLTDLKELMDDNDRMALEFGKETRLQYDISRAGPGKFSADILGPEGKVPVHAEQSASLCEVVFTASHEGDHYIHLFWCNAPLANSPILAYCPGPVLPVDVKKVVISGRGCQTARATMPAEFLIDGRKAGPGVPEAQLRGVRNSVEVAMQAFKYDRYRCSYTAPAPGSYLLFIHWSGQLVNGAPYKITVTTKGDGSKVKVTGEGLRGGIAGHEFKVFVDTREAGSGDVTALCMGGRHGVRCELKESEPDFYTVRFYPPEAERHQLHILYDDQHVPGSPFLLRVGEPPDPQSVKVFGPGVESGLIQTFQSRFLVDTHGAGAGQLAVKIRGPRGGFKVDIRREAQSDRMITCRYDPQEPGLYVVSVRWSGDHVPGSPFQVNIYETQEDYDEFLISKGLDPQKENSPWRAEI